MKIFKQVDTDNSGEIDIDEFRAAMRQVLEPQFQGANLDLGQMLDAQLARVSTKPDEAATDEKEDEAAVSAAFGDDPEAVKAKREESKKKLVKLPADAWPWSPMSDSMVNDVHEIYPEGEKLGEGGFGAVFLSTDAKGKKVAVKLMKKREEGMLKSFQDEVRMLKALEHQNSCAFCFCFCFCFVCFVFVFVFVFLFFCICFLLFTFCACDLFFLILVIKFFKAFEDRDHYIIVNEFAEGGSVISRLSEEKTFTESVAAASIRTMLEALQYCHQNDIVHRDLVHFFSLCCFSFSIKNRNQKTLFSSIKHLRHRSK
jgi:hypothetical protein